MFGPGMMFRALSSVRPAAAGLALLVVAGILAADDGKSSRTDAFGDPLPEGASARLGTARWRHEGKVAFVAYAGGGKLVVTSCGQGLVHVLDAETGKPIRTLGTRFKAEGSGYDPRFDDFDEMDYAPQPTGQYAAAEQAEVAAVAGPDGEVHVWDLSTGTELHSFKPGQRLESITFTPDGKLLVTRTRRGLVKIWDVAQQEYTGKFGDDSEGSGEGSGPRRWQREMDRYGNRTCPPVVSPDGKLVALLKVTGGIVHRSSGKFPSSGTGEGSGEEDDPKPKCELLLYDIKDGKEVKKIKVGLGSWDGFIEMTPPVFSPDGKQIALCRTHGGIYLFDVETGKLVQKVARETDGASESPRFRRLLFSPDGKQLAALADDDKIRLYDCGSGKELRQFGGEKIEEDVPLRDRKRHGRGSGSGYASSGYYEASFVTEPTTVAWSRDGKTMVQTQGRLVRLWNTETGKGNDLSGGHLGEVSSVAVATDGKTALTVGSDRTIRHWDVAQGKELKKYDFPENVLQCQLVSAADALAVDLEGSISFLDPLTGKTETGMEKMGERMFGRERGLLALSANRRTLAATVGSVLVRSANLDKHTENKLFFLLDFTIPNISSDPRVCAIACAPDGQTLAARVDIGLDRYRRMRASGEDEPPTPTRAEVTLCNIEHGTMIWVREVGTENCSALTFSPNGRTLAMINGKGEEVTLLESRTGKVRARIKVSGQVLAFSSDGLFLGLGTQDGAVKVVDARDGKEIASFKGHNGAVTSLAFTADAGALLSSGVDGTVLVWKTEETTRKARPRPPLSSDKVNALWDALADPESDTAYQAMVALSGSPKQAVTLLKERLKPAKVMEEAEVDKLINELNGDSFENRQKALRELGKTGERYRHIFQDALENDPAPEARKHLEQLLAWLEPGNPMPEIMRDARAIEVLESFAAPEARALLESLAKGARGSPLTREAAAALRRMGK